VEIASDEDFGRPLKIDDAAAAARRGAKGVHGALEGGQKSAGVRHWSIFKAGQTDGVLLLAGYRIDAPDAIFRTSRSTLKTKKGRRQSGLSLGASSQW